MINLSGVKIEAQTYYAVQFGLVATIAYYTPNDSWMIIGYDEIKNADIGEDFVVYKKILTHKELLDL